MVWQDWSHLNKKYADVWMAGLGGGVFDGGDVLQSQPMMGLGASGLGAMSSGDTELLQTLLNYELVAQGRSEIAVTAAWDQATCVALTFLLQQYQAMPNPPTVDSTGGWIIDIWNENKAAILAACEAVKTATTAPPPPPPTPTTTPTGPGNGGAATTVTGDPCDATGCDCYVFEGNAGPHITDLQQQLNVSLEANGYEGIEATSVYDKATCGAIFELGGSFRPTYPAICTNVEGEWLIPLECPGMILPTKKGGMGRAGMFAIGGLVLAAGLGGAYWIAQR